MLLERFGVTSGADLLDRTRRGGGDLQSRDRPGGAEAGDAPWKSRIHQLIEEMPAATEEQIGWKLVEEISAKGAGLLAPIFEQHKGRNGRLSIQTIRVSIGTRMRLSSRLFASAG